MNSPAESWAAKCKLYIYEDVANCGVTDQFLKQQVKIADKIDPRLGQFLKLVGKVGALNEEEMDQVKKILQDSDLSKATFNFCNYVVKHYRFEEAFLGSLKRVLWHHYIPQLSEIEAKALDNDFKEKVVKYLESFETEQQVILLKNLPLLASRIREVVMQAVETSVQ